MISAGGAAARIAARRASRRRGFDGGGVVDLADLAPLRAHLPDD